MTELVIYRGLPASGKTTLAKAWVAEDPAHRARVNRDDLRLMLHDGYHGHETETQVTLARDRLIETLLRKGISVANDDTNLRTKYAREIAKIGVRAGATVTVIDLTDVPLEECVARDEARRKLVYGGFNLAGKVDPKCGYVGMDVIRGMHERFLKGRLPLPELVSESAAAAQPYVPTPGTPAAVMVDLDGTLCLHDGRGPYDETLVHTDLPNPAVVACIRAMDARGYRILYVSGRSDGCAEETLAWIHEHVGTLDGHEGLLMRESGDRRRDSIVKGELFDRHIRDAYDVKFVLDDRQQVVDAWREIGLTVFQVAPGDF